MLQGLALLPINHLLQGEGWARELLKPHASKGAALSLGGVGLRVRVTDEGLLEKLAPDIEPAVSIDLPASALSTLGDGPEQLTRHATISGDAGFAETISQLLKHLRPDIGAALSPIVGDVLAHRIDTGLTKTGAAAQQVARNLTANAVEYVRDEQGLVVQQEELSTWQSSVKTVEENLARLEARVMRLAR